MAIKPDKSRIMFTTEGSFEYFLKDRCFVENRNMSNLVDTILKNYYKDEYVKYLSSIEDFISDVVCSVLGEDEAIKFMTLLNHPNIPFSLKVNIRNRMAHADDICTTIDNIYEGLQERTQSNTIYVSKDAFKPKED